jgi:hypothetical protein
MGDRARVAVLPDHTTKTYKIPSLAAAEAEWYRRVPWATPRLLDFDGLKLTIETRHAGTAFPHWRPADALRELLSALHAEGIHHRDVHLRNVVKGKHGVPLLIDWETAIEQPAEYSYDLWGPDVSRVPVPTIHARHIPAWWGSTDRTSIMNQWGVMPMGYQAQWKDGREVRPGQRDCAGRYEAIRREVFPKTGFRVLDVGAYEGYFSVRLAEEFGAVCTAVDDYRGLPEQVVTTENGRVEFIRQRFSRDDLDRLSGYDVTLLLSVLHHVPWWREMLAAAVTSSRLTFVELADARERLPGAVAHAETFAMHDAVNSLGGIIVALTPGYDKRYDRKMYALGRL